jgi:ATP synthase subunit 6
MVFSPLEQFKIVNFFFSNEDAFFLYQNTFGSWILNTFFFTNFVWYSILLVLVFLALGVMLNKSFDLVPKPRFLVFEVLMRFVSDIMKQQAPGSEPFLPFFFTIFIFILFSNLVALTPFSFSITAQIAVTFTFAFSCNFGFCFLGFQLHGLRFLRLFVPAGVPNLVLPLIVIIEFISYLLRTFSLSLRLFANIMAGHTLLHILIFFSYSFLINKFYFLSFIPFVLVFAISFLEFGVAILQAYVFVVLLSIYVNDSITPGHLLL